MKLRSERLSAFHGRPVTLRAGVLLPRDFDRSAEQRFPLWLRIGGFGSRYTFVRELGSPTDGPPLAALLP